jgi:hypothetical protein
MEGSTVLGMKTFVHKVLESAQDHRLDELRGVDDKGGAVNLGSACLVTP